MAGVILRLQTGPYAGQAYELRPSLRIGRHPYNEVSLADEAVSRYHCWLKLEGAAAVLEDLASANGTFVNGIPIQGEVTLKTGDRLRVGGTEFLIAEEAA